MKEPPNNPWLFSGSFMKTSGSLNFPNDQNWEFFENLDVFLLEKEPSVLWGLEVSGRRNRGLLSKSNTRLTREET
jgi:hypothetical protein